MKKNPLVSAIALSASLCWGSAQEAKHFWNFEGTSPWNDKVGAAHGSAPAGTTLVRSADRNAAANSAVTFQANVSGALDHLYLDGTQLYQSGTDAFSMTFWYRIGNDGTTDPRGIFDFSGNGSDGVQSLYIGTESNLAFRIDFPGTGFVLAKVAMPEDGAWHFVAATYDPAVGLELHVDGFGVDGSATAAAGSVVANASPYLGSFNFNGTASNKGLNGDLDDVAMYQGVLSPAQIAGLFSGTLSPLDFAPGEEAFRITRIEKSGSDVTVYWPTKPGGVYSIWYSDDLVTWRELADSILGTGEEVSYIDPNTEPTYFYRVQDDTP